MECGSIVSYCGNHDCGLCV